MKYEAKLGDEVREVEFKWDDELLIARSGDHVAALDVSQVGDGEALSLLVNGESFDIVTDVQGQEVTVQVRGERYVVHVVDERERAAAEVAGNKDSGKRELRAAMPGVAGCAKQDYAVLFIVGVEDKAATAAATAAASL